ncbi:MAG: 4-(cytidine 5'-diphospho)-2-C-methyl-D-erythritol kinase [Fimbriimonadia bacterium]|jgi:4-diphosphocytidyl-2-C-methyl-D-erythritol kinase
MMQPPAKINLTLDIGPLGGDGYHAIDTIFQAVDLRDDLVVDLSGGPVLPEDNLVTRALRRLDAEAPWSVRLKKRIPERAGLGGGSSDCAAALLAGARLLDVPVTRLARHAACLGSDVAFFLVGGAARGRGRGEHLTPLPDLPPIWFCLAKPSHGVPTPEAFGLLDKDACTMGAATERLAQAWAGITSPEILAPLLANDFEPVVRRAYPEVDALMDEVRQRGALGAVLCGSGSAIAALTTDEEQARRMAEALEAEGYWARAVRTLRRDEWP